jgi:hypothetical protein
MKTKGKCLSVALLLKKGRKQCCTIIGQHTTHNFAARMNDALTIVGMASKLAESSLLIVCSKHYAPNARVVGPTCAHHAGFKRYIQGAIVQRLSI